MASASIVILLNAVFSSLTAIAILSLGRQQFGEAAGLAAAWAWAVSPPIAVMPWLLWETSVSALVMTFALMRTLRLNADSRLSAWSLCGCIWGFAALLNPSLLAPLPFVAAGAAAKQRRFAGPAVMLFICAMVIGPWTVRNFVHFHRLLPVRSNFWPEAYFGNVSFALHPSGKSMIYQREGEIAFGDNLRREVLAYIHSNPGEFARHTAQRIYTFWTQPPQFAPYGAILALAAVAGIVTAQWLGKEWFAFGAVLGIYPALHYLTYTLSRYRHPIEPVMYALAGFAASEAVAKGYAALKKKSSLTEG